MLRFKQTFVNTFTGLKHSLHRLLYSLHGISNICSISRINIRLFKGCRRPWTTRTLNLNTKKTFCVTYSTNLGKLWFGNVLKDIDNSHDALETKCFLSCGPRGIHSLLLPCHNWILSFDVPVIVGLFALIGSDRNQPVHHVDFGHELG